MTLHVYISKTYLKAHQCATTKPIDTHLSVLKWKLKIISKIPSCRCPFSGFRIHVHFQVVLRADKLKSMNLGRDTKSYVTAKHHAGNLIWDAPWKLIGFIGFINFGTTHEVDCFVLFS